MVYPNLEEAIAELKKHPETPVRAHCGDLDVELRAVKSAAGDRRLGDFLASVGPWAGESREELTRRLREARRKSSSSSLPTGPSSNDSASSRPIFAVAASSRPTQTS